MIFQERGVFILHPKMIRMKPDAVVGSLSRDHRDGFFIRRFIVSRSLDDFTCPPLLHGLEQIDSIATLVRKNDIFKTVFINVDKPKASIMTVMIDDLRSRRQRERKF